jgi:glycosyltransferase involved in cell wall biosynthesis
VSEKNSYGASLKREIARLGLQNIVELPGPINEDELVAGLLQANVFVIASLLENSPNSLCEAQLVGLPCVASYVGGIPSLVQDEETGLLFPSGDAAVLATCIQDIFVNDDMAMKLGASAKSMALERNDPTTIVEKVIQAYQTVIKEFQASLEK